MTESTRVAVVGLGPIGLECVRAVLGGEGLSLVAAVDSAPALAGRDLGEVTGHGPSGLRVVAELGHGLDAKPDVVVLCTSSRIAVIEASVTQCVARGAAVVSTCEELAEPWGESPDVARRLDAASRAGGVAVLGTGINPGFVMDRWPAVLAQACVRVEHVHVTRIVDASKRRGPLQVKVGSGLSPAEFHAGVAAGRLGHVGLSASARLCARALGITGARVSETIAPVVVTHESPRGDLPEGCVAGVRQRALAHVEDREVVRLDLEMSMHAPEPHDRVVLRSDPPVDARVAGGYHGDRGTIGAVLSGIRRVRALGPGLRTAID